MKYIAIGILIPILVLAIPNVYAESNSKRASDGFNDGSQAALSDKQNGNSFNPACDPTGAHTSDGQHTTTYCNAWTNGYTSAWNDVGSSFTNPGTGDSGLKDKFCNFLHSGDGAAASALVTLLGYGSVAAAAQALCV